MDPWMAGWWSSVSEPPAVNHVLPGGSLTLDRRPPQYQGSRRNCVAVALCCRPTRSIRPTRTPLLMKGIAKRIVFSLCWLAVAPLWLIYRMQASLIGRGQALTGWSQLLSLLPGLSGIYLRRAFYSLVLAEVGPESVISFGVLLSDERTVIGRSVYIGPNCVLGEVEIGDDVLLGSHVSVMNGARQHGIDRLDVPIREQPGEWPRITIGRDSWIGDRAIVMADVGEHCVVGAGAVVTKPIPDYAIVVGNPARIVKYRNAESSESNSRTAPVDQQA